MIYKNLEAQSEIGILTNIRKMQVLKIGQFNQIWQMREEKALMQKPNYNWQDLDVVYDLLSTFIYWGRMGNISAEMEKNHDKLIRITPGAPSVEVAVQRIPTWGFELYVDTTHTYGPIILYGCT